MTQLLTQSSVQLIANLLLRCCSTLYPTKLREYQAWYRGASPHGGVSPEAIAGDDLGGAGREGVRRRAEREAALVTVALLWVGVRMTAAPGATLDPSGLSPSCSSRCG